MFEHASGTGRSRRVRHGEVAAAHRAALRIEGFGKLGHYPFSWSVRIDLPMAARFDFSAGILPFPPWHVPLMISAATTDLENNVDELLVISYAASGRARRLGG